MTRDEMIIQTCLSQSNQRSICEVEDRIRKFKTTLDQQYKQRFNNYVESLKKEYKQQFKSNSLTMIENVDLLEKYQELDIDLDEYNEVHKLLDGMNSQVNRQIDGFVLV